MQNANNPVLLAAKKINKHIKDPKKTAELISSLSRRQKEGFFCAALREVLLSVPPASKGKEVAEFLTLGLYKTPQTKVFFELLNLQEEPALLEVQERDIINALSPPAKEEKGKAKKNPPSLEIPEEIKNSRSLEARELEIKLLGKYLSDLKAYYREVWNIKFDD
ncbi:MAG: hypothetical protein QW275_00175 [Candidatus Anstonellaceae archaeon]